MKSVFRLTVLSLFGLLLFCTRVHGQTENRTDAVVKAAPGTFQFIQTGKDQDAITSDYYEQLLVLIEQQRDDNNIVYYPISANTTIMILPRTTIENPAFQPVPEFPDQKTNNQ